MLPSSTPAWVPRSFLCVLILSCVSFPLWAQAATLQGRVLDPTGARVVAATVLLRQGGAETAQTVVTDETGAFQFSGLPAGRFLVRVTATGFAAFEDELTLASGESRKVEWVLRLASVAEQVVVTAARITGEEEAARLLPGTVNVLDRQTLESSRVFTFTEALRKVPGLFVRDEEGFGLRPNIGIRGLNPTRSSKVLLLEDGIPLAYAPYGDNASYYHPPIDRFEEVEVLKGSGQILYGPSTVGGVINYLTPPPPGKSSGSVRLLGGNREYFNGHLSYGGTWGNTGLLLDYLRKQGEGARANTHAALNDVNFKLLTALGARQAFTLRTNYYGEDSNVTYSGLRQDEYAANPRQNPFRNDFFFGDRWGLSATHSYVFTSAALLTTTFYWSHFQRDWWRQSSNSNQRPNDSADPNCGGMQNLDTTCGNEGRLREYSSGGFEPRLHIRHALLGVRNETDLGGRAHTETQDRRQENGAFPTARTGTLVESNVRRNQAYSAFVQNRFLLGKWSLTPGVRLERIFYERTNRLANGGAGATGKTGLTQVVPGLGVSYAWTQNTSFFAGVHRGFAPPRTEDIVTNSGGTVELDPELSWNYEVGVRSQPHRAVRLQAAFFRMNYENQVIPASVAGGIGATLTNGGQTLQQGAEWSARVDAGGLLGSPHNIYLRLAYTYLPIAEFTGTRTSSVSGFESVSVSGNRLPYAPHHMLNFVVGYVHPRGLDMLPEAVSVSKQFGDDLNTIAPTPDGQRGLIPGSTLWNATVNYTVEAWRSTFFVSLKNLFDRTVIVDRTRGILPSSPRLLQAGLKLRF